MQRQGFCNAPKRSLFDLASNFIGNNLRPVIPPRVHFEMVAWGYGSKVHAALIVVQRQHDCPAIEAWLGATAWRVEEDDSVAKYWVFSRRFSSDRPRPALILPDVNSVAIGRPLALIHLIKPHCHVVLPVLTRFEINNENAAYPGSHCPSAQALLASRSDLSSRMARRMNPVLISSPLRRTRLF